MFPRFPFPFERFPVPSYPICFGLGGVEGVGLGGVGGPFPAIPDRGGGLRGLWVIGRGEVRF